MRHPGLLHSLKSFLAGQDMQSFVELIAKLPSGVSEIAGSTASEQSPGRVVEHRQQVGSLSHTQLRMILAHGGIPSIMQAVFNPPVSSNQLQEALGISQSGWQAGDAVAHLVLRPSQRISALAFQLEDLSHVGPATVASKVAAHRDTAFLEPSMAFLHRLSLPKIHRGGPTNRAGSRLAQRGSGSRHRVRLDWL
jgi:hypothetical protein